MVASPSYKLCEFGYQSCGRGWERYTRTMLAKARVRGEKADRWMEAIRTKPLGERQHMGGLISLLDSCYATRTLCAQKWWANLIPIERSSPLSRPGQTNELSCALFHNTYTHATTSRTIWGKITPQLCLPSSRWAGNGNI